MDIYFPFEHSDHNDDGVGGSAVTNPDVLYVFFDPSEPEDWPDIGNESIIHRTTLTEIVERILEGYRCRDGYTDIDAEHITKSISAALRAAADLLDTGLHPT